jgi:serine/threonine-protein kinase
VGRRGVLAALAVLLAAGGGGAAWILSRESPVPVPAVVGLAEAAAVSALEASGLSAEVRGRVDEQTAAGLVTAQDPPAGANASSGSVVVLTVSQGPAPRRVPDLSGLDADAAAAALAAVQLRPGSVSRVPDEAVPAGTVLRWAPTGEVPRGSAVDLVLSDGPAPRIVPNISGMTPDAAKAALPEGLSAEVVEVFSDSVPEGTVVSANYRPGASVARGPVIRIRVSKGPELLVVPDVSGRTVGRATALLKDAGFDVVGVDGPPDGTVRRTDPAAGRTLPRGSDVRLVTS